MIRVCETDARGGRADQRWRWWATSSGCSSRACRTCPHAGEVVHAEDPFAEPAGGGAVAAVQLARLAGAATLVTRLGDDDIGARSRTRLAELGVDVRASVVQSATRSAVTLVDDAARAHDHDVRRSAWNRAAARRRAGRASSRSTALYFTAGDEAELRLARSRSRALVASPRARKALGPRRRARRAGAERRGRDRAATPPSRRSRMPSWWCGREGERGGHYRRRDGETGRWDAVRPPGAPVDSYGCGDSFAAGLHVRPRRGHGARRRARARRALRRGMPDGTWSLRTTADRA